MLCAIVINENELDSQPVSPHTQLLRMPIVQYYFTHKISNQFRNKTFNLNL